MVCPMDHASIENLSVISEHMNCLWSDIRIVCAFSILNMSWPFLYNLVISMPHCLSVSIIQLLSMTLKKYYY